MGRGRKNSRMTSKCWSHTGCCPSCGKAFTSTNQRLIKKLLTLHTERCQPVNPLNAQEVGNVMARQMRSMNSDNSRVTYRDTRSFNALTQQEMLLTRLPRDRQVASAAVSNVVADILITQAQAEHAREHANE